MLNVGDVVTLKSGSPLLTITKISNDFVGVFWFSMTYTGALEGKKEMFPTQALIIPEDLDRRLVEQEEAWKKMANGEVKAISAPRVKKERVEKQKPEDEDPQPKNLVHRIK